MNINIYFSTNTPIYQQIFEQIKDAILKGDLVENQMLPSIRFLAKELKISNITTKRAYEELERFGYIFSVVGKGSFVSKLNPVHQRREDLNQISENLKQVADLANRSNIKKDQVIDLLGTHWHTK